MYSFLKDLCEDGDDANYGDSILCDIFNLQAISKRVHYGILVMEAKYNQSPDIYDKFLDIKDDISISSELKNVTVELKVLERVREKAIRNGINNPDIIVDFFKNILYNFKIVNCLFKSFQKYLFHLVFDCWPETFSINLKNTLKFF